MLLAAGDRISPAAREEVINAMIVSFVSMSFSEFGKVRELAAVTQLFSTDESQFELNNAKRRVAHAEVGCHRAGGLISRREKCSR